MTQSILSKSIAIAALVTVGAFTLVAQQGGQPSWEQRSKERFKVLDDADKKAIADVLPKATATPKSARNILVFYRCEGFIHTSIPFANEALKQLGEATKAFHADFADSYDVFSKENLAKYDLVALNNTTDMKLDEGQREALLGFVKGGKGLVGIHAASDNFKDWPEGLAMIGGVFTGHPWGAGGTWAFKLDDPQNALNAAFEGKGFWHKDEIYWYKPESFVGRDKLHVLLSLDMSKAENQKVLKDKSAEEIAKVDVPVSWCRPFGEGRVFYSNIGHNDGTFSQGTILQHFLDGIQYALGDLDAVDQPALAPAK